MNHATTDPSIRRDLNISVADGAAYSLMVGMGETYLPAFVLAIGLGQVSAGLIATVPMLIGAVMQLASLRMIRRFGTHRRWVIASAAVQGLSFLPFVAAAWRGMIPLPVAILFASLYWGAGHAAGPAWNRWMARIVPWEQRATFFAHRTRVAQAAVLTGLVGGGYLLHWFELGQGTLRGFLLIFTGACVCRLISSTLLFLQREPADQGPPDARVSLASLFRRSGHSIGPLLTYMVAVQIGTHLAASYFNPFMLKQLCLPYGSYVLLLAAAFVGRVLILPFAGKLAHRYGARRLLLFSGIGIAPMAAVWLVSGWVPYLVAAQLAGGACWAAYELATFLLLFERIPDEERTSILTSYNLINSTAIVTGAVAGGALLRWMGEDRQAYLWLFLISSAARVLSLLLIRRVEDLPYTPEVMGMRTVAVRPGAGAFDRPILASMVEGDGAEALAATEATAD